MNTFRALTKTSRKPDWSNAFFSAVVANDSEKSIETNILNDVLFLKEIALPVPMHYLWADVRSASMNWNICSALRRVKRPLRSANVMRVLFSLCIKSAKANIEANVNLFFLSEQPGSFLRTQMHLARLWAAHTCHETQAGRECDKAKV